MERFVDSTVDRIHYLIEQSSFLLSQGQEEEAALLYREAESHAAELREVQVYS